MGPSLTSVIFGLGLAIPGLMLRVIGKRRKLAAVSQGLIDLSLG